MKEAQKQEGQNGSRNPPTPEASASKKPATPRKTASSKTLTKKRPPLSQSIQKVISGQQAEQRPPTQKIASIPTVKAPAKKVALGGPPKSHRAPDTKQAATQRRVGTSAQSTPRKKQPQTAREIPATKLNLPQEPASAKKGEPKAKETVVNSSESKKDGTVSEYDPEELLYKKFVSGIYIDRVQSVPRIAKTLNQKNPQGSKAPKESDKKPQVKAQLPAKRLEEKKQDGQLNQKLTTSFDQQKLPVKRSLDFSQVQRPQTHRQMTQAVVPLRPDTKPEREQSAPRNPSGLPQAKQSTFNDQRPFANEPRQQHQQYMAPQNDKLGGIDFILSARENADSIREATNAGAASQVMLESLPRRRQEQNGSQIGGPQHHQLISSSAQGQGAEQNHHSVQAELPLEQVMTQGQAINGQSAFPHPHQSATGQSNIAQSVHQQQSPMRSMRPSTQHLGGPVNHATSMSDRYSMHIDGLSFDALFGSHYDSDKDEDYSIKEDLIQNTKTYQNDFKPYRTNVSKAEIAYLKSQQKYDSLLFAGREHDLDFLQNPELYHVEPYLLDDAVDPATKFFDDEVVGQRRGTRSQLGNSSLYPVQDSGKRRRVDEMRSECVYQSYLHPQPANEVRMTRQRMHQRQEKLHREEPVVAQGPRQLVQNSSNMNIFSSEQSNPGGPKQQSNGSSLRAGAILNRHQDSQYNSTQRGQTPTKAKKTVQTKSIEVQVSPSLLESREVGFRAQPVMHQSQSLLEEEAEEGGTISKRRLEKKTRRKRRSRKQIEAEEAEKKRLAAVTAASQARLQSDRQMAFGLMANSANQVYAAPPYSMLPAERRPGLMQQMGPQQSIPYTTSQGPQSSQTHQNAPGQFYQGSQHQMSYPHMRTLPFMQPQWSQPPPQQFYPSQGEAPRQPSVTESQGEALSSAQPSSSVNLAQQNPNQKRKKQSKTPSTGKNSLVPMMLFGKEAFGERLCHGRGPDFNVMEHFYGGLVPPPIGLMPVSQHHPQQQTKKGSKSRNRKNSKAHEENPEMRAPAAQSEAEHLYLQQQQHMQAQKNILSPQQEEAMRSRLRKEFYPFFNQQLKELVQQIEMYIQLLYQVLLFDENSNGNKSKKPAAGGLAKKGTPCSALLLETTPQHQTALRSQAKTTQSSTKQTSAFLESLSRSGLLMDKIAGHHHTEKNHEASQEPVNVSQPDSEEMVCKQRALALLQQMLAKRDSILRNLNLPTYEVPWLKVPVLPSQAKEGPTGHPLASEEVSEEESNTPVRPLRKRREPLKVQPQVSYMQSPLLEYAPFVVSQMKQGSGAAESQADLFAQELNLKVGGANEVKGVPRYSYKECWETMKPLVNKFLLPPSIQPKHTPYPLGAVASQPTVLNDQGQEVKVTTAHSNNNRRKFSRMDDNMLILGLQEFGPKHMEHIRMHWLPRKSVNEIKHRYKNLTCQRVHDNLVKQWKYKQSQPLTEREFYLLCQGVKWFGESTNRWGLIARTFLPERTLKFVQVEFSAIVTDFDRSNRLGRMLLLDVPDEKLLTIAHEIPEDPKSTNSQLPIRDNKDHNDNRIDITDSKDKQKAASTDVPKTENKPSSSVDPTYDLVRKKVQKFEMIDIDRISEFVTTSSVDNEEQPAKVDEDEGPDNDLNQLGEGHQAEGDSAIMQVLNQAANQAQTKVKLDSRLMAAGGNLVNSSLLGGANGVQSNELHNGDNNTSGGLASFLQENLLLSEVDRNNFVDAGPSIPSSQRLGFPHIDHDAVQLPLGHSQQSMGDFLRRNLATSHMMGSSIGKLSPSKPLMMPSQSSLLAKLNPNHHVPPRKP